MHCKHARDALIIGEFEPLDGDVSKALSGHLERCARCRTFRSEEEILSSELASLGTMVPEPGPLTARVMAEIRSMGTIERNLVPDRHLALASLGAFLSALVVILGGIMLLPILADAAPRLKLALASMATTAAALGPPLQAAVEILAVMTRISCRFLLSLGTFCTRMFPMAVYATAVLFILVALTSTIVAARDLVSPGVRIRKES